MKHLFRRWWFWLILIVVLGILSAFLFSPSSPVEYVTETIQREDLTQTVDANGEVVSLDEVDLSFDLSGTVQDIFVQVGDVVEPGDALAMLDTKELVSDVQNAYQAVQVAQGNLDAQKAGSSDETIAVTQSSVNIALASLESSRVGYEQSLELVPLVLSRYSNEVLVQKAALTAASDNVDQTIEENALLVSDAYDDLLSAAWAGVIEARAAVAKADEVLGVRNSTLNDDYQNILSSGNAAAVQQANTAFIAAEASLAQAESSIVEVDYGSSGAIVTTAEYVEDTLHDSANMLLFIRAAVSAMPATGDLSVSEATALASSIDAIRASLQVDQAALQNAFQNVQGVLISSTANLEDSRNSLAQAQASYDASVAAKDYQVTTAEHAVDSSKSVQSLREAELAQAQASLTEITASPRVVDLAAYEAEVSRAQAAYQSAVARLEKAEIQSPIMGEVTAIAVDVGEQVVAANAVITVQTTQEQFEIMANISESDIAKLDVGQEALITLDAFGSSQEFTGSVRTIDPAEKLVEGVVYYEATISIDVQDQSLALRPGLSADIILTTNKKDQALTVSQRALQTDDDRTYVRLLVDGEVVEKDVTTGLRGDLGRVEITSGLAEGDIVIIRELTP